MTRSWHQNFKRAPKERRTSADGEVFDTISEMNRWNALRMRVLAGEIRNLRRQVTFPLEVDVSCCGARDITVMTRKGKVASYTADFVYEEKVDRRPGDPWWVEIVEDHKGYMGPVEELRIAVFEAFYDTNVRITGAAQQVVSAKRRVVKKT